MNGIGLGSNTYNTTSINYFYPYNGGSTITSITCTSLSSGTAGVTNNPFYNPSTQYGNLGVAATVSGLRPGTTHSFTCYSTNIFGANSSSNTVSNSIQMGHPIGQQAYNVAGTYSWIAPTDVWTVHAVVIGGGSGGGEFSGYGGGGGGGLAYVNNISVTPGTSYTVVVGNGGPYRSSGGASYFINTSTVRATGATSTGGAGGGTGGSNTAGIGGTGGTGGTYSASGFPGAGGAGGYGGNGGSGGNPQTSGGDGSQGAAGGSGGSNPSYATWGGGGTDYFGAVIATGTAGIYYPALGYSSTPSAGSAQGIYTTATTYGGANNSFNYAPGGGGGNSGSVLITQGGAGGVRIIWGNSRSFPSTNTTDRTAVP
jgi:hypothetical protein